jgi:hypothetical protein
MGLGPLLPVLLYFVKKNPPKSWVPIDIQNIFEIQNTRKTGIA